MYIFWIRDRTRDFQGIYAILDCNHNHALYKNRNMRNFLAMERYQVRYNMVPHIDHLNHLEGGMCNHGNR